MLDDIKLRFVLVKTTHPGNIGATARAIKNMGFYELYLVQTCSHLHADALARASGAEDILENAVVVSSLHAAISDCNLILGTSSRERALSIPVLSPRECSSKVRDFLESGNKVAILFGQERTGLTNEELAACHYHIAIPCNNDFASLNLAAAVQVIAYELHLNLSKTSLKKRESSCLVSAEDLERFYDHLERTLIQINFLDPHNPRQMMRKLRRLFNRVELEQNEINILRGILTTINKQNIDS